MVSGNSGIGTREENGVGIRGVEEVEGDMAISVDTKSVLSVPKSWECNAEGDEKGLGKWELWEC